MIKHSANSTVNNKHLLRTCRLQVRGIFCTQKSKMRRDEVFCCFNDGRKHNDWETVRKNIVNNGWQMVKNNRRMLM